MDDNFLLHTKTAERLFHDIASKMPIIDYHCHLSPQEVFEDKRYDNITQVWLYGDHYKWRLMRANGIEENRITGDASDEEKFRAFAATMEIAVGSPVYHWSHLELKRYFGYDGLLRTKTADEIYAHCSQKLREEGMSARGLIAQSGVKLLCTTDDPVDDLHWHEQFAKEADTPFRMLPAWRPDKAMNIESEGFADYIKTLQEVSGVGISSFTDWKEAMAKRMDFFASQGCVISDHGINTVPYLPADEAAIDAILAKRLRGETVSATEKLQYKTACMRFLGREYAKRGWVMQLHFGAKRNNRTKLFTSLGADVGGDSIGDAAPLSQLADYLNALDTEGLLPKTILYSLNPNDNAALASVMGCFQDGSAKGKLQHGSAWWFNDHIEGMRTQMISLANQGMLAHFVGMLTDSRSFLSYTRHEYFRRILCDIIGDWVEDGLFPDEEATLKQIIEGICYNNARDYFGFSC